MIPRTPHPGQLDLFIHSDSSAFANDAIDALLKRDAARAEDCIRRIIAEDPAYRTLGALQVLCQAVLDWPFPSKNPEEIADAVQRLEIEVTPAAETAMRGESRNFMGPLWLDLANAASRHDYDAEFPESFSAGLYLRCGENLAAAKAAESVPNWNDKPDLLYWLSIARYRIGGLEVCRSVLMRLALLAPNRLSTAIADIGDPKLHRDWLAFKNECYWLDPHDENADAWFPAWYIIQHSESRIAPDTAPGSVAPAVKAFVLILSLVNLEKRGYSPALVLGRSKLRDLEPQLFAVYMARRGGSQS